VAIALIVVLGFLVYKLTVSKRRSQTVLHQGVSGARLNGEPITELNRDNLTPLLDAGVVIGGRLEGQNLHSEVVLPGGRLEGP
jgi:hypothetical protein